MNRAARRVSGMLIVGAILTATVLRFSGVHARSVGGDEVISLAVATGNFWYPWQGEETEPFYSAAYYRDLLALAPGYFGQRLHSVLRLNDQAPVYYIFLTLWLHLFGSSEAALRSLSVLASVASIVPLYLVGRYTFARSVGIYAAWVFAVAPFQVAFGLYNRPYALLGLFSILSALAAVRISSGKGGKWFVVYAVATILGTYTHYVFVWNIAFHTILIAWYQRHDRRVHVRFGHVCLIVAASCLLWGPTFLEQARWSRDVRGQSWFYWYSGSPSVQDTINSLGRNLLLLLSPGRFAGFCGEEAGAPCRMDGVLTLILYLVPLAVVGLSGWRLLQDFRRPAREPVAPDGWVVCLLWSACVFAGPVIMDLVLDSRMVSSHRYFVAASGPVYITVAVAIVRTPGRWIRWAVASGFLLFLLAGSGLYLRGSAATLMYDIAARDVAREIDDRSGDGSDLVLVLDPGPNPMDFAYYLQSNPDFARVRVPAHHPSSDDIPAQLERVTSVKERGRIWFLDDKGPLKEAQTEVLRWLRMRFGEGERIELTNVGVSVFSSPDQRR